MKLFDLSGRVAVITGISRGIGRELAYGFAEAGAKGISALFNQPDWYTFTPPPGTFCLRH